MTLALLAALSLLAPGQDDCVCDGCEGPHVHFVLVKEGGGRQGVYDPHSLLQERRTLVRARRKDGATGVVRKAFHLAGSAQDREVTVASEAAVFWRLGPIRGPAVEPKEGKGGVTLPAAAGQTFELLSGGRALEKLKYAGEWKEIP